MASGNIDSASLMNAVEAYSSYYNGKKHSYESYENWDEWTRKSIFSVTMLLIGDPLIMAPAPIRRFQNSEPHSNLYKCYDKALESFEIDLRNSKSQNHEQDRHDKFTEEDFVHLLERIGPNDILRILAKTENESSFEDWIKWAIRDAWVDHAIRNYGLFNYGQIDVLSHVFDVSKKTMVNLWEKTKNKSQVILWSEGADHDDDFELAKDVYIASAILRGLFHEKDAFETERSCQHHPLRQHMLTHPILDEIAPLDKKRPTRHTFTDPMKYLVSLIVTAPWKEEKQIDRVILWRENIKKVKLACMLNKIDPRFSIHTEISDEDSILLAIDTARDLKLRIYPKNYEKYIGYARTLFMGCLGFISQPWWFGPTLMTIDLGMQILEKENPFGRKICENRYLKNKRLDELAKAQAGQIDIDFPCREF